MKLIPQPQRLTLHQGFFRLTYLDRITLDVSCPTESYDSACLLAKEVEAQTGLSLMVDRRSNCAHRGIRLFVSAALPAEGYTVEVTAQGVAVTGGNAAGLHYGIQTLRQVIRQQGCLIPMMTLEDQPDLPERGLFYDATRCRVPSMDFMKRLADLCSFYKLNQLHLYIEHTFLFDGLSEVWRDDTPLTAQDILELDAYCRKLHIDLVPSVATLGHLYKVLRTKTYRHLSEIEEPSGAEFSFMGRMAHHTLDVTQEASLDLVYRMLDEFSPLFTSTRFNINGDEPFDLGRGRGKESADRIGSHQMYVDWIAKICRHVKKLGKQPMFWGDVILADPATMRELPQDIICMNWDYAPSYREDHAKKLFETGATQYLCPGVQGWKQTVNLFDIAYANIHKMASLAHKYKGAGLLVTEWGDFGHLQDPESSLPGILYAAAMGWNKDIPTEEALNEAISVLEYGDSTGKTMSVLRRLSQQVVMNWGHIVEFVEISRGRFADKTFAQFRQDYGPWIEARLPQAEAMNETIDACQEALCRLMPGMREPKRMLPYFLLSDGQKLLNRFAVLLSRGQTKDAALAAELEIWYNQYKKLWRTSSQESELYRLGEVIFWMADFLR